MFGRKLLFCSVRFPGGRRCYYYRTEDKTLRAGDVVIVPVGRKNERRAGQVLSVERCRASEAPLPPGAAPWVLRRAGPREAAAVRRRMEAEASFTVDISQRAVRTLTGYKMVPLSRKEREALRRRYEKAFPGAVCVERLPLPRKEPLDWIDRLEEYLAIAEE